MKNKFKVTGFLGTKEDVSYTTISLDSQSALTSAIQEKESKGRWRLTSQKKFSAVLISPDNENEYKIFVEEI